MSTSASLSSSIPLPVSGDIAMRQAQAADPQVTDKIKKSAKEFEGMFMSEMLSHMFDSVDTDKMFGGGQGEQMFRGLLTQEYGKMVANGSNSGISGPIQNMMLKIQEQQQQKG